MHNIKGVGLIEVLIAVLVLSVGILGMISMQVTAKRNTYESTQRSIATALARDILERIRSNPGEVATYAASSTLGGSSISIVPASCNSAACTTSALAARDLYEWEQLLDGAAEKITIGGTESNAGGLVDPRACITNVGGVVTVAIAWKGVTEASNPSASTCGESSGLYGASYEQRRLMVIQTYISDT